MKIKPIYIELLLYILLSNVYINLVGSISISELWVLLVTPSVLRKNLFSQFPIFKKITIIYIFYLLSQLTSEFIIGNELGNIAKGLMTTLVSYFSVLYLFDRLHKDFKLIVFVLFCTVLKNILFMNSTGLGEEGVVFDIEASSYFKYKITPILTSLALFISYFLLQRGSRRLTIGMLLGLIFIYITFSARSASLALFFSALMLIFGDWLIRNKQRIIPGIVMLLFVSYGAYAFWVNYQLYGNLKIRNIQIDQLENPYNPIEMLIRGRSEVFIGIQAFKDNYLLGYGAWAMDVSGKYERMMMEMTDSNNYSSNLMLVPSHSIIIGAGVTNGIFAFLSMAWLILFFFKLQLKMFGTMIKTPFAVLYLTSIIGLIWTSLFSPLAHLRISLPMTFAITLVFYYFHKEQQTKSQY